MAVQTCPSCGRRGFTWSIDEEVSPLIQWYCSLCRYSAEEDESRQTTCAACGGDRMWSLLVDRGGASYWFCFQCHERRPARR